MPPTTDAPNYTSRSPQSFALDCVEETVSIHVSQFTGASGVSEYQLVLRVEEAVGIECQLAALERAYFQAIEALEIDPGTAVLRRFFCSDLINQVDCLRAHPFSNPHNSVANPCAISWVGQPPLGECKVALWASHIADPDAPLVKSHHRQSLAIRRGSLTHHWTCNMTAPVVAGSSSYQQTETIFADYSRHLNRHGMQLDSEVVRTWLYAQNVDADYHGIVQARREFFATHGLTPDTHYIASTGIGGSQIDPNTKVSMDSYAIEGLQSDQIEFLTALDHLGPTQDYGVTFERGTAIAYRDRKQLFISGTASIDPDGTILHPGDVTQQLDRTLENIGALLQSGGGDMKNVTLFIVYIRDPADHQRASATMQTRFGNVPTVVVLGPVCRPGWLIEIEALATVGHTANDLPFF